MFWEGEVSTYLLGIFPLLVQGCQSAECPAHARWQAFVKIHSLFLVPMVLVPAVLVKLRRDGSELRPTWQISVDLGRVVLWLAFPLSIRFALSGCPEGL